ncbi:hypothetical protein ABZ924_13910 [Streptomyces sp. NPDC046876]|uniref:hypothetical protein n=1 Tax=Streptomyces sp. NPDC046876 TaxID=3155616 RepID=UPI0033E8B417
MSMEIAELVQEAGPYVTAALGAYGHAVLTRVENAAADSTAAIGQRVLEAVWRRRDPEGRATLETAVQNAAEEVDDPDALAALRLQIKRALRDDPDLLNELAALLPAPAGAGTVNASGERAIAAQSIGVAITGDNNSIGGHPATTTPATA